MIPETLKELSLKVSQYFLDFLESDFKRQQAPRRRIILQTDSGFKAGMSLSGYPTLQKAIWNALEEPWDASELAITPRAFTRTLSHPLRLILREQVEALNQSSVDATILSVVQRAKGTLAKSASHPEEWVSLVREELASNLSAQIVRPMLSFLDEALKNQAYSSVDSVFNAESDLISTLAQPLDEQLPEILARYSVSRDTSELMQASVKLLNLSFIKPAVSSFFESFAASDAFLEFRDLETYVATSEGNQLYLYIGTVKYGSTIYPLLYLPLDVRRDENNGTYTIKFTNQLYANKRATDFILQELGARQQKQWLSPVSERITYLASTEPILTVIEPVIQRILKAFGLLGDLRLAAGPIAQQSDTNVAVSNGLYFCAFEKADEALLNDYEEMISHIRTNQEGAVSLFQAIIQGVIEENPVSIDAAVDKHWQGLSVDLRAVPDTPIPLNEEQQKVLQAIRHEEGRIIVVEGPPGTGKSHTIVAIAADCAFRKKSCLVVSDKAEALEVVYDKLSKAMNEVRGSEDFPNPLLRLGTEQANFRRLTSAGSLAQVGAQVKATNANRPLLEADRDHRRQLLRAQISSVIAAYGSIKTADIAQLEQLAKQLDTLCGGPLSAEIEQTVAVDPDSALPQDQATELADLQSFLEHLFERLSPCDGSNVERELSAACLASTIPDATKGPHFNDCPSLRSVDVPKLTQIAQQVLDLRKPIIGWLFTGRRLRALATECQAITTFRKTVEFPADLKLLKSLISTGHTLTAAIVSKADPRISFGSLYATLAAAAFPIAGLHELKGLVEALNRLPTSATVLARLYAAAPSAAAGQLLLALRYARRYRSLCHQFAQAPPLEYVARKTEVEKLNTALMNAEVDSRLVSFMENSRADARVLAKLIKDKQKFPEEKFETVKQAFPVMIASIREFGEYMPLKQDLVDVLVIDEASQVSVAQAFPALLRARKIVVMGDSHQFANTKSTNASIELNQRHRGQLEAFFKREVSQEAAVLERLSYFDVKRSVLDFGQLCANYRIMLRKHFRSYKELIHYCSTTFYQGQLQAIKIRNTPLAECIEFHEVEPLDANPKRNTNPDEARYILQRCVDLLDEEDPPTVGIITPFREQQSFISHVFSNDARSAEFRTRLKLKVMTFDTCQGEERNIIFYSLVATRTQDLLNYIFPVELGNAQELIGEKLKMQRLNVGLSRAQETVCFVLSKPIVEYRGSIGQALRHFDGIRKTRQASAADTDPLSPMEQKVLEWIYATPFYQLRSDSVEVMPQFPLGEYLRQLDPGYKHPAWRVDFLVSVEAETSIVYVVIEYDGFEYHFTKGVPVSASTHDRYLNEADVERQLTLESYGYRFLRINRFNMGSDPVTTLSKRLEQLTESSNSTTGAVKAISEQAVALTEKTAKACERCGTIKPTALFFDKNLGDGAGGVGRICIPCKNAEKRPRGHGRPRQRRRRWV